MSRIFKQIAGTGQQNLLYFETHSLGGALLSLYFQRENTGQLGRDNIMSWIFKQTAGQTLPSRVFKKKKKKKNTGKLGWTLFLVPSHPGIPDFSTEWRGRTDKTWESGVWNYGVDLLSLLGNIVIRIGQKKDYARILVPSNTSSFTDLHNHNGLNQILSA